MELVKYVINLEKKDDVVHIMPMGDVHLGNPACDDTKFIHCLEKVRLTPNLYTIGMGDYFENNNAENERSRKTFEPEMAIHSKAPMLSQQARMFLAHWRLINHKTIGLLYGNHDRRTLQPDMFKLLICENLGVRYLGSMAYILLQLKHEDQLVRQFKILAFHSRFGGQKPGSVSNSASNKLAGYNFDVVLFGHTHFAFTEKNHTLDIEESPETGRLRLLRKRRYIGNTGSFLFSHVEGVETYPDDSAGTLRDPGTITITFDAYNNAIDTHG